MRDSVVSDELQSALLERLDLLDSIREVFLALYPAQPRSFNRGCLQEEILTALKINPRDGWNRRAVNEALVSFGYTNVKSQGTHLLKKNPRKKNNARRLPEITG
jgi:hypothetical protein